MSLSTASPAEKKGCWDPSQPVFRRSEFTFIKVEITKLADSELAALKASLAEAEKLEKGGTEEETRRRTRSGSSVARRSSLSLSEAATHCEHELLLLRIAGGGSTSKRSRRRSSGRASLKSRMAMSLDSSAEYDDESLTPTCSLPGLKVRVKPSMAALSASVPVDEDASPSPSDWAKDAAELVLTTEEGEFCAKCGQRLPPKTAEAIAAHVLSATRVDEPARSSTEEHSSPSSLAAPGGGGVFSHRLSRMFDSGDLLAGASAMPPKMATIAESEVPSAEPVESADTVIRSESGSECAPVIEEGSYEFSLVVRIFEDGHFELCKGKRVVARIDWTDALLRHSVSAESDSVTTFVYGGHRFTLCDMGMFARYLDALLCLGTAWSVSDFPQSAREDADVRSAFWRVHLYWAGHATDSLSDALTYAMRDTVASLRSTAVVAPVYSHFRGLFRSRTAAFHWSECFFLPEWAPPMTAEVVGHFSTALWTLGLAPNADGEDARWFATAHGRPQCVQACQEYVRVLEEYRDEAVRGEAVVDEKYSFSARQSSATDRYARWKHSSAEFVNEYILRRRGSDQGKACLRVLKAALLEFIADEKDVAAVDVFGLVWHWSKPMVWDAIVRKLRKVMDYRRMHSSEWLVEEEGGGVEEEEEEEETEIDEEEEEETEEGREVDPPSRLSLAAIDESPVCCEYEWFQSQFVGHPLWLERVEAYLGGDTQKAWWRRMKARQRLQLAPIADLGAGTPSIIILSQQPSLHAGSVSSMSWVPPEMGEDELSSGDFAELMEELGMEESTPPPMDEEDSEEMDFDDIELAFRREEGEEDGKEEEGEDEEGRVATRSRSRMKFDEVLAVCRSQVGGLAAAEMDTVYAGMREESEILWRYFGDFEPSKSDAFPTRADMRQDSAAFAGQKAPAGLACVFVADAETAPWEYYTRANARRLLDSDLKGYSSLLAVAAQRVQPAFEVAMGGLFSGGGVVRIVFGPPKSGESIRAKTVRKYRGQEGAFRDVDGWKRPLSAHVLDLVRCTVVVSGLRALKDCLDALLAECSGDGPLVLVRCVNGFAAHSGVLRDYAPPKEVCDVRVNVVFPCAGGAVIGEVRLIVEGLYVIWSRLRPFSAVRFLREDVERTYALTAAPVGSDGDDAATQVWLQSLVGALCTRRPRLLCRLLNHFSARVSAQSLVSVVKCPFAAQEWSVLDWLSASVARGNREWQKSGGDGAPFYALRGRLLAKLCATVRLNSPVHSLTRAWSHCAECGPRTECQCARSTSEAQWWQPLVVAPLPVMAPWLSLFMTDAVRRRHCVKLSRQWNPLRYYCVMNRDACCEAGVRLFVPESMADAVWMAMAAETGEQSLIWMCGDGDCWRALHVLCRVMPAHLWKAQSELAACVAHCFDKKIVVRRAVILMLRECGTEVISRVVQHAIHSDAPDVALIEATLQGTGFAEALRTSEDVNFYSLDRLFWLLKDVD